MPLGNVETFCISNNNWDAYVRRLKQFIALNKISDDLKVATLVTVVGGECYELMCDLCAPCAPESKSFDELIQLVKEHLEPDRSEIAERHIFRKRTQKEGESIREYLQALKHLAKTCNFGACLETCLRDQFVSGIVSEDMRSRIFAEKGVDYKRAVELALALEAAERHAATACAQPGGQVGVSGRAAETSVDAGDGIHRYGVAGPGNSGNSGAGWKRPCGRCGKSGHRENKCRFKQYSCDVCGQKGHLKAVCKNASANSAKTNKGQFFLNEYISDEEDSNFYNLASSDGDRPYFANIIVENKSCKFEIDTGSKISVISKHYYEQNFHHVPIVKQSLTLRTYTGNLIETLGYIVVNVRYGSFMDKLHLFVIENGGPPLMGRTWIKKLKVSFDCHKLTEDISVMLRNEYPEVFAEGLGTFKSELKLHLKDNTPVYVKARPLPLALRVPVENELQRLQQEGVIYKVERSDYGTPIVPVVKSNGTIRLCGDYKITLNPKLKDFHYPLPRIEELFAILGGGEHYTKLDLSNAFQQCILDEESQPLTAITTHMGTFFYKRVPFGIKCIPENFQKIMEETLHGLPSTAVFADDICVTGKDRATHLSNLRSVLQRLKDNGLRINFAKCQFFKDSVTYLGYKIDKTGLHTDKSKVEAIIAAPTPSNVTQLKSFLGLVNFYSKFCVNLSSVLQPLYKLLKKNVKWVWEEDCEKAFRKIKNILSNAPVLAHYEPSLPLILSVDSSAYGLGAVLTQRHRDGGEKLLCCASRTLSPAELNYSQLDKEALAIVFGVSRHHQYLYGRHFQLRSDHRPLSYIFGEKKGIPVTAASRLQRYAVKLAAYDFEIMFVKSEDNSFADTLSRLPLDIVPKSKQECSYLHFIQSDFPISFKDIKCETAKDPLLSKIYGYVMFGWPVSNKGNDVEIAYFHRKDNLHIDQGCVIWGYRVVIPKSLREKILKEIHDGHPGIVKMKQIARNYVWWENLDDDIARVANECVACRAQRAMPAPAPLHTWPFPPEPWSRLHLDFLGPFDNNYFLVIVDAHSMWIEVENVKTTSAVVVIDSLRRIFARFGLPKRVVSDNGPPFSSLEFAKYLQANGIKHSLIAPYHPASNGAAENAVRSIKRVLKKAQMERESFSTALSRFLFMYRNTEQASTGREPAVALLGRRLRGRLDLLRPDPIEVVRDRQLDLEQRHASHSPHLREAKPGDAVLIRDYTKNNTKWAEGNVVQRSGPVSYVVQSGDGRLHKRHVDQMITNRKSRFSLSQVPDRASTFDEGVEDNWDSAEEEVCVAPEPLLPVDLPTQRNTAPHEPRPKRQAALRCVDKLKEFASVLKE